MSSTPKNSHESLRRTTKVLQAVTATMSMGAVIGLIVVVGSVPEALNNDPNMLVILGAFTGMVSYGLSYVVASILNQSVSTGANGNPNSPQNKFYDPAHDPASDPQFERISSKIANSHIIRSAIIEGAVFLNLMVLLLERNYISVTVILLGVMLLAVLMPTYGRLLKKVEKQLAA